MRFESPEPHLLKRLSDTRPQHAPNINARGCWDRWSPWRVGSHCSIPHLKPGKQFLINSQAVYRPSLVENSPLTRNPPDLFESNTCRKPKTGLGLGGIPSGLEVATSLGIYGYFAVTVLWVEAMALLLRRLTLLPRPASAPIAPSARSLRTSPMPSRGRPAGHDRGICAPRRAGPGSPSLSTSTINASGNHLSAELVQRATCRAMIGRRFTQTVMMGLWRPGGNL